MRTQQYRVELTDMERAELLVLVRRRTAPARTVLRAQVLLRADAGAVDRDTAAALHTCAATVGRVRRRFAEAAPGAARLTRALHDASRASATPMLGPKQEAHLIALACSDAPAGRTYWTMQLLADRLVELQVVPAISDETVRRALKKTR